METYIAFLRGINVGGHKKIKMVDLRETLEGRKLRDVRTYIQSGNVIFKSNESDLSLLEAHIKHKILKTFKFEVPVLVRKRSDLESFVANNPFTNIAEIGENRMFYFILKTTPQPSLARALEKEIFKNEEVRITPDCAYLACYEGLAKGKLGGVIERRLKVEATARNHRTLLKLLEMTSPNG